MTNFTEIEVERLEGLLDNIEERLNKVSYDKAETVLINCNAMLGCIFGDPPNTKTIPLQNILKEFMETR